MIPNYHNHECYRKSTLCVPTVMFAKQLQEKKNSQKIEHLKFSLILRCNFTSIPAKNLTNPAASYNSALCFGKCEGGKGICSYKILVFLYFITTAVLAYPYRASLDSLQLLLNCFQSTYKNGKYCCKNTPKIISLRK